MSTKRLIVGLGNPGPKYQKTRHNLGFLAVIQLATQLNLKFKNSSFTKALSAEGKIDGHDVCLLLPLTYMNNSGLAVKAYLDNKGFVLDDLLVIADDFNLDFADMRLRRRGSDGGHNGLGSIIEHLTTEDFARLRLGIGKPQGNDIAEYVLEQFNSQETVQLDHFLKKSADCCLTWINHGIDQTMEQYNRRGEIK